MNLKLGVHVSISGGISNSVTNALNIGCTAFQIFTRSPRQWNTKDITFEDSKSFKDELKNNKFDSNNVIVHMPYLPNLSAPNSEMYEKSVNVLTDELKRCNFLGIPYLVIHLGSHLGHGKANGVNQLVNACNTAQNSVEGNLKVKILLENSAGQKNSLGSKIEDLVDIFEKLEKKYYGFCLDTCHLFAAGYDISKKDNVAELIQIIDADIGINNLKLIHLNDSKGDLGSNLDRHYHIGLGKIGVDGFKAILDSKKIKGIPLIMETPIDEVRKDLDNMQFVRKLSEN